MAGKSMKELAEWKGLKGYLDPRLVRALAHPVRGHIFAVLGERVASGSEIGEELGADVSSFYHHIQELERLGCIERVGTRRRRGAKEHFFRAKRMVFLDDAAWRRLPKFFQADLASSFVQRLVDEFLAALETGVSGGPDDHLSWSPGRFDPLGWIEARELMDETLERLMAIRRRSAERLAESGERGLEASVGILAFRKGGPTGASER